MKTKLIKYIKYFIITFLSQFCLFFLFSCAALDDYFLGKDNTLKPKKLSNLVNNKPPKIMWEQRNSALIDKHKQYKMSPVISKNFVYVANSNGKLLSISKKEGKILWAGNITSGILTSPKIEKEIMYIASNNAELFSVSVKNGNTIWKCKLNSDIFAKPLILKNQIIVKTIDGSVYSINKNSGKIMWRYEHPSPKLILKASSSPVSYHNNMLVAFADGKLDLIRSSDGAEIWQRNVAHPKGVSDIEKMVDLDADPILLGDTVVVASYQGLISRISLENGEIFWKRKISVFQDILYANGVLYVVDANSVLWAISANNGVVLWHQKSFFARGLTQPIKYKKYLVLADSFGWLHILDKRNGAELSRTQVPGTISVSPATDGEFLYVLSDNGYLRAYSVDL